MSIIEHHWSICFMCGPVVICGACGNNCCNGTYGTAPGGLHGSCTYCPSAYEMQDKQWNGIKYYISRSKRRKKLNEMFEE